MHYVVGDVHGCYDDLRAMLNKIETNDRDATIILVGDFIDRGPKVWQTIKWCMENITSDGKYQSVIGNHEDMALQWYYSNMGFETDEICQLDSCDYGFVRVLISYGINYVDELKLFIGFFRRLPLYKKLNITMTSGKRQDFIIKHSYIPAEGLDKTENRNDFLWSRNHYWGYIGDEIIIHGHTPTIDHDYILRGENNPGFINYRHNTINVDGGCSFFPNYLDHGACMLCAICLETLEEIYPYDWEERMRSVEQNETYPIEFEGMTQEEIGLLIKENRIAN